MASDRRCRAQDPHPEYAQAVTISRFWRLVSIRGEEECWPWIGDLDRHGYGTFYFGGRNRRAHELALSFTTGEKRLQSLDTCHSCDNPACCNPEHLRFDSRQSNVDDMITRGRNAHGSKSKHAKLTEADVLVMRERRANGARMIDLAKDFAVTPAAVTAIVHGRNWKHVGGPITNRQISRTRKAE